jgi:hypothetical protein
MSRSFAQFLSVLLHPVLMPTYALWFMLHQSTYFNYTTTPVEKIALFAIVILNTLLFPIAISYFLLLRGWIKSFEMEDREERLIPFIINATLLFMAYYLMRRLMLPRVYSLVILGAAVAVVIAIIINLKWKISIHMIGIGGIIGLFFALSTFLYIDFRIPILICTLLAGLLGTARLTLGAHSLMQVYAGFAVGFLCELLLLQF